MGFVNKFSAEGKEVSGVSLVHFFLAQRPRKRGFDRCSVQWHFVPLGAIGLYQSRKGASPILGLRGHNSQEADFILPTDRSSAGRFLQKKTHILSDVIRLIGNHPSMREER